MQICRRCCCGRTPGCLSGNRIWQCLLPSQPPAISLHIAAGFDFLDHHSLSLLCKSSGAKCSLDQFASSFCSLLPASVQPLKMDTYGCQLSQDLLYNWALHMQCSISLSPDRLSPAKRRFPGIIYIEQHVIGCLQPLLGSCWRARCNHVLPQSCQRVFSLTAGLTRWVWFIICAKSAAKIVSTPGKEDYHFTH